MRSATLRWIMVGCSIVIAFIIVAQLYWLRRVYNLEQHQFKRNVLNSAQALIDDLKLEDNSRQHSVKNLVEMIDPNTYVIKLNIIPPQDTLRNNIVQEFEDYGVWADCKVAVYNAVNKQVQYEFFLTAAKVRTLPSVANKMPVINTSYDHLLLFFPNRSRYIIQEMSFWIRTAILLILVLIGLSVALLYLYRQKFLNELQKDFVNNFTHEFKTPLAVMKIAADVLVQPDISQKPERMSKYSQVIKEQTEHLQARVERLLRTAAIENNKIKLKKELCQLNDVVQHAISQIEPLISSRKARIDFTPDENEPVIMADKSQLQLVIINLIENAIKYSQTEPHIIIQLKNGNHEYYTVSVKDNGVGIDEKHFKFLFKKFYRVPTGNVHNVTGFGLGLNFVKKIVDAHGGKITIHSVVGIGTEFNILLPKK